MSRRERKRTGVVLLEVLVALVILGTVGAAVSVLATGAGASAYRSRVTQEEMERASGFLDAVALWTREDLDRHLGDRPNGAWRLEVQREHPILYVVTLTDSSRARVLLRTALYRPLPWTGGMRDVR